MIRRGGRLERLARGVRALAMRGRRVECPVCGGRFRAFLPGGPERRPGAQCPGCGSLERQRLLWLYLRERTSLFSEPTTLLHIAPERALTERLRALPHVRYVSGDLAATADVRLDLERLPFRDATFGAVLASHVLEHVADARRALAELFRVVRPGGWAILQSPIDASRAQTFEDPSVVTPADRLRVFGQSDHARIFGRDYPEWIRTAGFQVRVDPYVRDLPYDRVLRYGFDRDEDLIVGARGGITVPGDPA